MRVLCSKQRTPAWFAARRGRLTASSMDKYLAGAHTKSRREAIELVVLDLEGVENFDDIDALAKPWMQEGIMYETKARGWYQFHKDKDVDEIGFALDDKRDWFGFSPDGLVPDDREGPGGVEFKCRKSVKSFFDHYNRPIQREAFAQMQSAIDITGYDWWDYCNYCPWGEEHGHVVRVYRDDAYIKQHLEETLLVAWRDVLELYRKRNGNKPWAISLDPADFNEAGYPEVLEP